VSVLASVDVAVVGGGLVGASVAYDPNLYTAAMDTQVTYDDFVAQGYDDGYGPKAYAQFEAALAPYGTWIDDAALGRVWIPSIDLVGPTFCPYATKGKWVLTEYGWTRLPSSQGRVRLWSAQPPHRSATSVPS